MPQVLSCHSAHQSKISFDPPLILNLFPFLFGNVPACDRDRGVVLYFIFSFFRRAITQECLDEHLLHEVTTGDTRIFMSSQEAKEFQWVLQLPAGLTCTQCVLQWKWNCGKWTLCFYFNYRNESIRE